LRPCSAAACTAEEGAPGLRGAAVLREVATLARRRGKLGETLQQRASFAERAHRVATWRVMPAAAIVVVDGRVRRTASRRKRATDDAGEHRRGDFAAVVFAGARLVDDHHRGEPRRAGRRDAAEHREIAIVA
jgi:hypothetical protein